MAGSISVLESLLARVRQRAAEPRPLRAPRPASRVALRSYADGALEIEDDDIEEYEDELVEIVDEHAPVPVPVRPSPIPASPATQRSEPPPPPPPLPPPAPRPPPTWDAVAARAKRSLRPVDPPLSSLTESTSAQPVTQQSPGIAPAAVVARSPIAANASVVQSTGQLPADSDGFVELLEDSLELGS